VPFVFALATPVAVLVIRAGEGATCAVDLAAAADIAGAGFATLTRLRALGGRREEQMRQPSARRIVHPPIVGENSLDEEINRCHGTPKIHADEILAHSK